MVLKKAIKNSGNQPEFQSSIKKRTVNQTVVYVKKVSSFKFQVTQSNLKLET
jgi:hypothetical protein